MSHSGLNCHSATRPVKTRGRSMCADKEPAPGEKKRRSRSYPKYLKHTCHMKTEYYQETKLLMSWPPLASAVELQTHLGKVIASIRLSCGPVCGTFSGLLMEVKGPSPPWAVSSLEKLAEQARDSKSASSILPPWCLFISALSSCPGFPLRWTVTSKLK